MVTRETLLIGTGSLLFFPILFTDRKHAVHEGSPVLASDISAEIGI